MSLWILSHTALSTHLSCLSLDFHLSNKGKKTQNKTSNIENFNIKSPTLPLVCGIPRGQCCTAATRAATAAPYPATASGEDLSATSRSAQRSSSGEHWDGIAMATHRRHQAAASRAEATGWRRTEITVSRRAANTQASVLLLV